MWRKIQRSRRDIRHWRRFFGQYFSDDSGTLTFTTQILHYKIYICGVKFNVPLTSTVL